MALKLIIPPTDPVITTAEAKAFLNIIDMTEDDTLIDSLIAAATAHVDGKMGTLQRALNPQTWELSYDAFPCGAIEIPLPPLISVESVKYDDSAGDEQTIDAANYYVDTASELGWIVPVSTFQWPTALEAANSVRIRFVAGYEEESGASGVPDPIKTAILIMVSDLYQNRESATSAQSNAVNIPTTAKALVQPYVIHTLA